MLDKALTKKITPMEKKLPNITTHFNEWYQEVIDQAELADQAPVRGCMVIRPYGYAIWEHIVAVLDKKIKDTGHQNAAFPLMIPESFLKKEASHIEGFSPELAIITHGGGSKLEEPLVVRPTSETIVHYMFARWIKSWRDLPLKINQWSSVVRWEMRTRPFLRTTEFWWQEGHTAHETYEEAEQEALTMLKEYVDLAQNYLAIPVIEGIKPESEKFAGADRTYTYEGLMPDGKALQMGTSHIISRNFARVFGMSYQNREGQIDYPYLTSWGSTTRLIGALIMTHGDQNGLILPPRIAPIQLVIVPIYKQESKEVVLAAVELLKKELVGIRFHIDLDETKSPGAKFYHWELKGVPLRLEIGLRDIETQKAVLVNRLTKQKTALAWDGILQSVQEHLDALQKALFERAQQKRGLLWHHGSKIALWGAKLETEGGFYQTGWCRQEACENMVKKHKATIRCILPERSEDTCLGCDMPSESDILVARAY